MNHSEDEPFSELQNSSRAYRTSTKPTKDLRLPEYGHNRVDSKTEKSV